jgi:1,4-dihydroxy-2-naphthoyl-CoA hydrolase
MSETAPPTINLYELALTAAPGGLLSVPQQFAQSLPDDCLLADLGISLTHIGRGASRAVMTVTRAHLNQRGTAQAGAVVALADAAAGWASYSALEDGRFTTANLGMHLLRPAREGDELVALARPVHLGRRTQVIDVEVSKRNIPEKILARLTCSQVVLGSSGAPA